MTLIALGLAGFSFVDADGSYWTDVLAPSVVNVGHATAAAVTGGFSIAFLVGAAFAAAGALAAGIGLAPMRRPQPEAALQHA